MYNIYIYRYYSLFWTSGSKIQGRKHWNCDWLSITLTWWISSARGGNPFCCTCQRSTMRKHRNVSRKLSAQSAERLRCCPRILVEELRMKRRRLRLLRIDIRMRSDNGNMARVTMICSEQSCSIPIWDLWEPQATSLRCFWWEPASMSFDFIQMFGSG